VCAAVVFASIPGEAQAYLDAGTGSMIVQVVIGTVAGAMMALRLYWGRIKARFTGKKPVADEAGDDSR
jgi:hypothetical protein